MVIRNYYGRSRLREFYECLINFNSKLAEKKRITEKPPIKIEGSNAIEILKHIQNQIIFQEKVLAENF